MTRRSPVSIGAIRPETGAHSDVRASMGLKYRAALRGVFPHPGVYPEPRRVHPSVSRRCRRLTPICDHGSGSPSPLVSIETRARARRGPRRGTLAPRAEAAEHRLYRCGRRRSRQPACERPYTLFMEMDRGFGNWIDARAARRALFPGETRSACTHTTSTSSAETLAAPLLKRAHTRAGHGVAP